MQETVFNPGSHILHKVNNSYLFSKWFSFGFILSDDAGMDNSFSCFWNFEYLCRQETADMALPSFFTINKNRRFNYIPRYYNPDKVELEERIRSIEIDMGVKREDDGVYVPRIHRGMMTHRRVTRHQAKRQSNIRLLVILAILLLISYFLFLA